MALISAFVRKVAFRYLRPKGKEGFISIIAGFSFLGIMLGVATLIVVMSVMNGFREELLGRILGFNGHIGVSSLYEPQLNHFDDYAEQLRAIPGVKMVTPLIDRQAMITSHGAAMGIMVHGIRAEDLRGRTLISSNIIMGSLDDFSEGNSIISGKRMAERLNLLPGAKITLIAPEGNSTPFGTMPRSRTFTIKAIFNVGMAEYDKSVAFIPLATAQKFYRLEDGVTGLEIFVDHPDKVHDYVQTIFKNMG
ncbi:MAG: lipoprotein-releasing system transmembrane subunit LolC, partial [Caedimonadaceae bacterium]